MMRYSNESSLPVLAHGAIYFSKFHKMRFGNLVEICFWLNLALKGLKLEKNGPIFFKFQSMSILAIRTNM